MPDAIDIDYPCCASSFFVWRFTDGQKGGIQSIYYQWQVLLLLYILTLLLLQQAAAAAVHVIIHNMYM